jgi:hypothetical protein
LLKIVVPKLELCRHICVSTVHIILKITVKDPGTLLYKEYRLLNSFITMIEKSHWKEEQ